MQRIDITTGQHPHFIGGWFLKDLTLADRIIDFFETRDALHRAGATGAGVDVNVKKSVDITIKPRELAQPGYEVLNQYMQELYACYMDYLAQWPFLAGMLKEVDIGDFNIQRYQAGGHFGATHSERTSMSGLHRVLVWMTYLNDVSDGGQTRYDYYDLEVAPQRGKTLIWPAEWTHAHSGKVVHSGSKYIITGWMHFPLKPGSAAKFGP
jgi:hypothetical protein